MKDELKVQKVLKWLNHFFVFFLLVAFVITCCIMLFVTTLQSALNFSLTEAHIATAAKITFLNVILISLMFTVFDTIRRKFTVERPIKRITDAAERIIQGDFSARVRHQNRFASDDTFNLVIDCFNKMAEELGSVETLRTDFIANVSHEMKTPLSIMQNYGKLLGTPHLSEEKRIEYANGIVNASHRMADMITNILKLNRLENQQIYPEITEFDLGEQLCECLLQYENIWEAKSIEIETDFAENVIIKADSKLLGLVWNNLLSNAFKFTGAGGKVNVSLCTTDNYAIVKVTDTGCGMTAEIGEHIFEKFYQGDSSHSAHGNGLGLALVKKVIDITQGEISVESIVGQGTTFTVKIRRR